MLNEKGSENRARFNALNPDHSNAEGSNFISVGSWSYDFGKRLFFATNETYAIFGRIHEEFDGSMENVLEFLVLEDRADFIKGMEAAYHGVPLNVRFRILTSSGELKVIHAMAELFYREDQSPDVMIGTVQDVTNHQIIESNISDVERKLLDIQKVQRSFQVGSWEMTYPERKLTWSEATFDIYGMDPKAGEPDFDTFFQKIYPEDQPLIIELLENMPTTGPFEVSFRIIKTDGSIRHIKHLVEVVLDESQNIKTIRGNIQDITTQKELEQEVLNNLEEVSRLEHRLKLVVDTAKDIFEIVDSKGNIQYISPAVEKMTGFTREEIEGHHICDYLEGEEKTALNSVFEKCIAQPNKVTTAIVKTNRKTGEDLFLEVVMKNHLEDPEVNGVVMTWKDMTSKVNLDNLVYHLVNYDELTGLPNRTFFRETLISKIMDYQNSGQKFGVFMIDIDEFKGINNVLSFEFGDVMIGNIGNAIKSKFGSHIFLARFYGDQFALIMDDIEDVTDAQKIAVDVLSCFNDAFVIGQYEIYVTASVGFSTFPDDGVECETLIQNANIALSRAKDLGKSKYHAYSPLIDIKAYKEFSLRNDLKRGIENGELEVYYQPIVNLKTGEIISAEALTRWNHPEWGLVPPLEFIPIAESTGLIIPMGKWILDQVCKDYKSWLEQGLPIIKVSVNYSVLEFYQINFVGEILETIKKHGLDPRFMILEITESVILNQSKQAEKDLVTLKSQGVQIAIDDFGTGYSSFIYLSAMNVDIIKIDRSFLDELETRESSPKVLKAIINLAKDLNMKIVAEGVSAWNHLSFLHKAECFAGQGYLFSKPVQRATFETLLKEGIIKPELTESKASIPTREQREAERFELLPMIDAEMTISEIKRKKVKMGQSMAKIKNIGRSGISFISTVKFPVKDDIVLQFRFELKEVMTQVQGTIVWSDELEPGKYLFGCEFIKEVKNLANIEEIILKLNA